jgi:hypothetical protein
MCQEEAEELSNGSEHCQVRKVAGLLAQALSCLALLTSENASPRKSLDRIEGAP